MKSKFCWVINYTILLLVLVTSVEPCNKNVKTETLPTVPEENNDPTHALAATEANGVETKCSSGCYKFFGSNTCRCPSNFFKKDKNTTKKAEALSAENLITELSDEDHNSGSITKCSPGCLKLLGDKCLCSRSGTDLDAVKTLSDGNMPILVNRPTYVKTWKIECPPGCFAFQERECRCHHPVYHGDYDY